MHGGGVNGYTAEAPLDVLTGRPVYSRTQAILNTNNSTQQPQSQKQVAQQNNNQTSQPRHIMSEEESDPSVARLHAYLNAEHQETLKIAEKENERYKWQEEKAKLMASFKSSFSKRKDIGDKVCSGSSSDYGSYVENVHNDKIQIRHSESGSSVLVGGGFFPQRLEIPGKDTITWIPYNSVGLCEYYLPIVQHELMDAFKNFGK